MTNPIRNVTPGGSSGGAATLALIISFTGILLLTQALFIVPAGQVAVVTTLGKVSGGSRRPGLNLKIPQKAWIQYSRPLLIEVFQPIQGFQIL